MSTSLLARIGRRFRRSAPSDSRPCAICALAGDIPLGEGHGRFCLYFGVRIAPDELGDTKASLRKHCLRAGNQFTWPVRGASAHEMLEWRMQHQDWRLRRSAERISAVVGVVGVVLTIAFKFWDWFVK